MPDQPAGHPDVIERDPMAEPMRRDGARPRSEVAQRDAPTKPEKASEPPANDPPTKKRGPWGLLVLGLVIIIAAIGGTYYWYANRDLQSTDDAYTDGRAVTITPQVKGQVVLLGVNDNQFVRTGDVLIKIDPRDYVATRNQAQGALVLAQAQLNNARINLATVRITGPAKLAATRAQLESAKAVLVNAQADYRRQHSVDPAATSRQNIDQANATNQQAAAQVANADAQVRQADVVEQDIASAEASVKQWEGEVQQDQARLDQADIDVSRTTVTAPQDGWITRRNVEMGNYVQPGGSIFSLVTPQVWVTANFKETELARMRPGQHVAIRVDAYPSLRLEGHVDSVQLGSGSKFSAFPAENATGNYIKIVQRIPVKIIIDSGLDPALPLPLGISVDPTVQLK